MSCPLCPKLGVATAVLLVVAHTAADGHAHEDEVAEESCWVCVAAADVAPADVAPEHDSRLLPARRPHHHAAPPLLPAPCTAYLARAPPFS